MCHRLAGLMAAAALLLSPPSPAAPPVHKCTVDGAVVYQSVPCPSGALAARPTVQQLNAERQKRAEAALQAASAAPGGAGSDTTAKPAPQPVPAPADPGLPFRCDGRQYCSQMSSCAEAKFFLAHCPGVKMDGDHNGVPCERQWCSP